MITRPQEQIRAPELKAVVFLLATVAFIVFGVCQSDERQVQVASVSKDVAGLDVIAKGDTKSIDVDERDSEDVVASPDDLTDMVALVDLSTDKPVNESDVVKLQKCLVGKAPFQLLVVPLQAPVAADFDSGTAIQLLSSTASIAQAVFIGAIDSPDTVPSGASAVAYAQVLVAAGDATSFAGSSPWTLLTAPPC